VRTIIRSMGRAKTMTTHRFLENYHVCVPESEENQYIDVVGKSRVMSHPDSVIGLAPKMNWILENIPNTEGHLYLDDDLRAFSRCYLPKEETSGNTSITDPEIVEELLLNTYRAAKEMGAKMFGWANVATMREHYSGMKPFTLVGWVNGCARGLVEGHCLKWHPEISLKEDYYVSMLNAYHYKICFKDERFCMEQGGTFKSPGGLAKFRTSETEKREVALLKKTFGKHIKAKATNSIRQTEYAAVQAIRLDLPY